MGRIDPRVGANPSHPHGEATLAETILRWGVVGLSLGLCGALWLHFASWQDNRDALLGLLSTHGIPESNPMAMVQVERERSPHHARLVAARALVFDVMQREVSTLRPEHFQGLLEAEALARQALEEQPNSWQGSMLLGTAIYLRWSTGRDRRLFTESSSWEDPLEAAITMAPGQLEPRRLLVASYLETWEALSSAKRDRARDLLRELFLQDESSLQQLVPLWFQRAGTGVDALDILPDRDSAWAFAKAYLLRLGRWRAVIHADERHGDTLAERLEADLHEAQRLRTKDPIASRELCLGIVLGAPPRQRFVDVVSAALETSPPGLRGHASSETLLAWLAWAQRMDGLGHTTLSPGAIAALVDSIDTVPPPLGAHAALLADDPYRLRNVLGSLAPRMEAPWAPFLVGHARRLLDAGELRRARTALQRVDSSSKIELPFQLVDSRLRLAEDVIDGDGLVGLRRSRWTALAWRRLGGFPVLHVLPTSAATGLRLELVDSSRDGDVIEILWDGRRVASRVVRPGQTLNLDLDITPEAHLLELRSLRRGPLTLGRVELRGISR